ncbi:hypothetical protein C8F01DRAFT_1134997 [Mycena amicta]|nr:hypothetical protein C8F01DRAFT_1134997 [Mycena amicta]
MRARLRIRPDQPVSLYAIPDTTDGSRPGTPLRDLIALAICGSENKMLSLRDIFQAIITRFRFYARAAHETGWKNSIRHALSLYSMFVHQPREGGDRGMGGYWRVSVGTGDEYVTRRNVAKASPPKHAQAEQGTPKKQTSRYEDDDSYDEGDTGGPQICPLSGVNHIDGKRKTRSATKAGRL